MSYSKELNFAELHEKELDEKLRVLSCKTRRGILGFIRGGPFTPREIAEQMGFELNTIKRHMKLLYSTQLVHQVKIGNIITYQTNKIILAQVAKEISDI